MDELLSVVVTVYNCAPYLKNCLDSILRQSYRSLEIILVNDGSTDESDELCEKYNREYPNIRYLKTENQGTAAARKGGIAEARGKYAAFVDGDDWIEKEMYENYIRELEKENADIVIGQITKDYPDKQIVVKNKVQDKVYRKGENYDNLANYLFDAGSFAEGGIHASLCSKVFRTEIIKPWILAVDDRLVYGEDAAALYPCILDCVVVAVTKLCGYHWVMRENSKTHARDEDYILRLYYLDRYMAGILRRYQKKEDADKIQFLYMLNQIQNALNKEYDFCKYYSIEDKVKSKKASVLFPFGKVPAGSRIVLYGAGMAGRAFFEQIKHTNYCLIAGVADRSKSGEEMGEIKICEPSEICSLKFDYIVIAILDERVAENIRNTLLKLYIPDSDIIWERYEWGK